MTRVVLMEIEEIDKKYDKQPVVDLTMDDIVAAGNTDYQLLTFSWALLDVCNYKCSYCSAKEFNQHTFINNNNLRTVWRRVLKTLSLNSIGIPFTVELLGGEPTLHPDVHDIVTGLCKIDRCVQVEITTNLSKPVKFFEKFNRPETSKVDVIASYHPEYYTPKFFEKVVEINDLEHITITPLINLFHEKKYWSSTLKLIDDFKVAGVNVACNLLYSYAGNDFAPAYTDEFWEIFEPIMKQSLVNEQQAVRSDHERLFLNEDGINKFFNKELTGSSPGFPETHRDIFENLDEPTVLARSRWIRLDENVYRSCRCDLMLSDVDIYKNKLYQFKGWKCRPLMWEIQMDGTIVNHCTEEPIPVHKINKKNLTACIECPLTYCDCNTKYQYVKQKQ